MIFTECADLLSNNVNAAIPKQQNGSSLNITQMILLIRV